MDPSLFCLIDQLVEESLSLFPFSSALSSFAVTVTL